MKRPHRLRAASSPGCAVWRASTAIDRTGYEDDAAGRAIETVADRSPNRLRDASFEKWQALGNDYLIVERGALPLGADRGADPADLRPAFRGRLRRDPAALAQRGPGFVAELRIFNPDGSEAELSGNGAREAVLYLRRTAGPTRTPSRSTRRPARSRRRSPAS